MHPRSALAVVLSPLFACVAFGQTFSPEQPAFSASPQTLLNAFPAADTGSNPATVLLEDARYEFDSSGRLTYRYRTIFKVWTKAGAESWAMIQRNWAPWQDQRPTVRARVIGQNGSVHELDPKTIADSPVRDGDDDVLTDRRMIRAPLPALEPGSVVEEEIVMKQIEFAPDPGTVRYFYFGNTVPVERTRVQIRGPETIPFRFKARLLPDLAVQDRIENGIREIVLDQGPMKPLDPVPPLLPPDEPRSPLIVFSTAKDWNAVAKDYTAVVERQLQGFDAARHLPKFAPGADREQKIIAIAGQLNREVRYTGIEFSEASVVPHKPAEVLERKYGDCKDKSTLAVALLRSAGIDAHVALLLSSIGADVDPGLPGMDAFNHAIVYVPGAPDIWLDLTDPDLRLYVVSPANQGRHALIARSGTTALMRTPELTAEENRVIERREFWLSEIGRAKVLETSETFGTPDRQYRGEFGDRDEKALRENLKSYVDWTYGEAKISKIKVGERAGLTAPFKMSIELEDAQRGTSGRTEAAVAIFVSQIAQRLPKYFKEEQKVEKDDGKPPVPPRTRDFYIPEPYSYEWHYIIHAPPGFRIRQLPGLSEEKLGLASLTSRFTRENDTTVLGDFRFIMPQRRFSAAAGVALRDAVVELGKRKGMLIYFDQIGETDLASGRLREAIAEFASLRKLHPREALHAMQTARALLAAGVGEAARAEAQRAVALEPASAKAYVQLAEVLKHDLVGRLMQKGFDADGAAAAYRKALELDPTDHETRANLAILLEYNRSGVRYAPGAKLEEALVEYKKILDKLASLGAPQNYGIALLRVGRFQELRDYLAKQPDNEGNYILRVCVEAIRGGLKAAMQQAAEVSGVTEKQRVLVSAGQTLLAIRQYELAADLFEASAAGSQNPAAVTNLVQVLRKTKRLDDSPETVSQPEDAVRVFFARIMRLEDHERDWMETFSSLLTEDMEPDTIKDLRRGIAMGRAVSQSMGVSTEVGSDLLQSTTQFSHEGSDDSGWLIRVNLPGSNVAGGQNQVWFVIKENSSYRIVGGVASFEGIARLVLHEVEQGHLDRAKIWLDRVRRQLPAGSGDDPLSGPLFSRVWQQGQNAGAKEIRRAAAMLSTNVRKNLDGVIAILEDARRDADATSRNAVSAALAGAYFSAKKYDSALPIAEQLLKDLPQSPTALMVAVRTAYAAGGRKEADRVMNANLDRFKNDVDALRGVAVAAMSFGDADRSTVLEKQIVDSGQGQASDYNQIAWGDLMAGKVTAETLSIANKGVLLAGNESSSLLHTLAAVDAELGKESEARTTLLQRMKVLGSPEPDDEDWYVFGRIAEQYGFNQEAASMYRRLAKPQNELAIPATSYGLAQKRLAAMGKPKA